MTECKKHLDGMLCCQACAKEEHANLIRAENKRVLEKAIAIVDNLYAQLPANKVWGLSGDDVCDNCEELIKNKLKSTLSESEKK